MRSTTVSRIHATRKRRPALLSVGLALVVVLACTGSPTDSGDPVSVQAARGGNGGGGGKGGGGPDPQVKATDPENAPQGVTLDVRVLGSNFEPGSVAEFLLAGQATGDITTNSTTFVSADELIANVTIDPLASTEFYDVQVATPRNKKGIGIELFEVLTGLVATGGIKTLDGSGAVREEEVSWSPENSQTTVNILAHFSGNPPADLIEPAFINSRAAAGAVPGNCGNGMCGACQYFPADLDQTDPALLATLADELIKTAEARAPGGIRANLDIKRLGTEGDVATSKSHTIQTEYWNTTFDKRVEVGIRELAKSRQLGTPTVELLEKDRDNGDGRLRTTYRVVSGPVRVWAQNLSTVGGPPTGPSFGCPLLDPVTLEILRRPQP